MKRQSTDKEKLFAKHISDKELISRIHKELSKPNNKEKANKKWTKDLTRHFIKEDVQIAYKYMKSCSTSLATREMQDKITMRYHYTSIRMANIKKTDISSVGKDVEKLELSCTTEEM